MSNIEVMYSVYFKKKLSEAKPSFEILRFDIRYSAVRSYIHVVSYEVLTSGNFLRFLYFTMRRHIKITPISDKHQYPVPPI